MDISICLVFGKYGPALLKSSGILDLPGFLVHSAIPAMVPEVLDFWISGFGILAHMGRP